MEHLSSFRPAPGTIPTSPGVYRFRDKQERVIYVGKAKNLRNRLNSYFSRPAQQRPLTRLMLSQARSVDWTIVNTEAEALQLEWTWIQHFEPRFNVQFRDDKSYPLLALSTREQYPRMWVYRGARRKNVTYFGPYVKVGALRETLDLLIKVFPLRTCTTSVMQRHAQLGRPCLLGHIDRCCAPCVGRVSPEEYAQLVHQCTDFLRGRDRDVERQLTQQMTQAAEDLDFERAARLRDQREALLAVLEKQTVVLEESMDADVIGVVTDETEASVQLFKVRGGRIRGQQGWIISKTGELDQGPWEENESDPALPFIVESFLQQYYDQHRDDIPRRILIPVFPHHKEDIENLICDYRGSHVSMRIPQRGAKVTLLQTVTENAHERLRQHKLRRSSDFTARSAALEELQLYLGLEEPPLRIECTDISHIHGTDVVASLVVFEDGLPKKSDYRTYIIKEAAGEGHSDDVGSIAEVTRRRFRTYLSAPLSMPDSEGQQPDPSTASTPRRFAYPPQLFIVDGAQPQARAAAAELAALGITDITVVGLAKRLEEIWFPEDPEPLILPRDSEALYLLQRIRDESHRTAISFHRHRRSRSMLVSELNSIPGLGKVGQTALLRAFGSVARLRQASIDEIAEVEGFGPHRATAVYTALHPESGTLTEKEPID